MIIEKSDPEAELTATATRIRPVLNPRQIAGVDSEGVFRQSYLRREREDDASRFLQQ